MPDEETIVITYCLDAKDVDNSNRNVFRLDKTGAVIWQIKRINHPETNWPLKHEMARQQGLPGCVEPFMYFRQRFPSGKTNVEGILPPDSLDYIPGYPVELANMGFGSRWFELDVETGIDIEITERGTKAW